MKGFASNVASLAGGGVIAQLISLAAMPLITRLYSTQDYGIFATFVSVVLILGPIATLRFNSALLVVSSELRAGYLFGLSIFSAIMVSVVTALVVFAVWAFNDHLALGGWVFVVPLAVLFVGIVQSAQSLVLRNKFYGAAAYGQISESLIDRAFSLGSAFIGGSSIGGLLLGRVFGLGANCVWLLSRLKRQTVSLRGSGQLSFRLFKRIAFRYRSFPLVSSWAFLANSAARELPVLLLAGIFGVVPAGFYALGLRVLNVPILTVGDAIAKVTLSRVREVRTDRSRLKRLMLKLLGLVFYLVFPVVAIMLFHGESLFALVFGEAWREAGAYAAVLAPAIFLMLAYRVSSSLFDLFEKQGARLTADVSLLTVRVLSVVLGGLWFEWSIFGVLVFMLVAVAVVYISAIGYLFRLVGASARELAKTLIRLLLFATPILVVSISLHFLEVEDILLLIWLLVGMLTQYLIVFLFDGEFKVSALLER